MNHKKHQPKTEKRSAIMPYVTRMITARTAIVLTLSADGGIVHAE